MHFLKREFTFPSQLNQALLQTLWNGNTPGSGELKSVAHALKGLWPLLAKERGRANHEAHYSSQQNFARTYASYYLPANLMKMTLVLEELRSFGFELPQDLHWLDVGTGPGTAFWGAAWWAVHRGRALRFLGLDQSKHFVKVAGQLGQSLSLNLKNNVGSRFETLSIKSESSRELSRWITTEKPNVLSFMNSLSEILPSGDAEVRALWFKELIDQYSKLAVQKNEPSWLILIEPGSRAASRDLLELRDHLRQREDTKIWLPCLNERPCGALLDAKDWCHEEIACEFPDWMNAIGAEAGLKKESLVFSYLVCSVGIHPEAPNGWTGRGFRVVSQLMKEKGLTQCFLCSDTGKKKTRVLNSKTTSENMGFLDSYRGKVYAGVETDEKGSVTSLTDYEVKDEADITVFPPLR